MSVELRISKTCMFATVGKNAGWRRYDDERKHFASMADAQKWLRDTYGKSKRSAMYRDVPAGGAPMRCGYVIGFRPRYREKDDPIAEQHWVEFRHSAPINLDTEKE